jgi:hypothetical protein
MEKLLAKLLERLVVIAQAHGEVEDTEVRERLDDALHHGFLIPTPDPNRYDESGNVIARRGKQA